MCPQLAVVYPARRDTPEKALFVRPVNRRSALTFLVAVVASALVWASSSWLTGYREPWDAEGPFYIVALVVAGSVAGALAPKPIWAHYLGAFVGQLIYELLFLKLGPLFLVGIVFLLGYSVVFFLAAAVAAHVRLRYTGRSSVA